MFHVYLARKQEKSDSNSFCSDPTLSQTLNSKNTDYIAVHAKNSCTDNNELLNSLLGTNDSGLRAMQCWHGEERQPIFPDHMLVPPRAQTIVANLCKRQRNEEEEDLGHATAVRRGPPTAPTSGRLSGSVVNDEWQTVRRSWAQVAALFESYKARRVWMPFYYDGACAEHLRALGFEPIP